VLQLIEKLLAAKQIDDHVAHVLDARRIEPLGLDRQPNVDGHPPTLLQSRSGSNYDRTRSSLVTFGSDG
jgi:hypothetical protein